MKSSSLQDFKAIDPLKSMDLSSKFIKPVTSTFKNFAAHNPSSQTIAQPPNISSPADFPALKPPVSKPSPSAASSSMIIGSIPLSSAIQPPAAKPPAAKPPAIQPLSALGNSFPASKRPPPAIRQQLLSPKPQQIVNSQPAATGLLRTAENGATSAATGRLHTAQNGRSSAAPSTVLSSSKVVDAYLGNFAFKPRHKINGIPCVSFFEHDRNTLLSKIPYIVIVKFSHNRPKYVDFRTFLDSKKFDKGFKVVDFDKKHVFIEFESFHDFVKLWILRSFVIKGFKARLFCWDSEFHPSFESFVAPVWIHLPGLPLYMFDEEIVLTIGSLFGKTLYIDPECLNKNKIGVLTLCVAMDVRKDVLKDFWIEFIGEGIHVSRFKQVVVYGDVPAFCHSCSHLGHLPSSCMNPVAKDLQEAIKGKQTMLEENEVEGVIPTLSVFKRLGVLGVSTVGKELGGPSSAPGAVLEAGEVENVELVAKTVLPEEKSATVMVEEPSLEPFNSLCGENGENPAGVMETRVNNLQISRRFEPLAALEEEKTSVGNGVLQQKTADCFEEATLVDDNSQTRKDEGGNSASLDSQVNIRQNPKEMRAKLSTSGSESALENRVLQISAADSDEEASLLADFSQLGHAEGESPSVSQSQAGTLQIAEKIRDKSLVVCSENSVEVGTSLQTAADFCAKPTLGADNSPSRDNQEVIFGALETSTKGLQIDASLDIPAAASDELYSDESGGSADAVQVSSDTSHEPLDLLPLLEAYHKGHFDVQVTPSKETEDEQLTKHDTEKWKHKVLSPALRAEMDEIVDFILKRGFKPP